MPEVSEKLPSNGRRFPSINRFLRPRNHGEREDHEKKAASDFTERSERNKTVDERINHPGKKGNENENQEGIKGLNLRWENLNAEEIAVHLFGLKNEGGGRLIKEAPENGDKQVQRKKFKDRTQALSTENFA